MLYSSTDEWIKKMWYIIHNGILLSHKKNEILPFAATQVYLEIIIPSVLKSDKERYYITYMWNLNITQNELIYKTETASQTLKTKLCMFTKGLPRWFSGKESACQFRSCNQTRVWSLGQEDPLEEEMATLLFPCILVWKIPWTGESGALQSRGS